MTPAKIEKPQEVDFELDAGKSLLALVFIDICKRPLSPGVNDNLHILSSRNMQQTIERLERHFKWTVAYIIRHIDTDNGVFQLEEMFGVEPDSVIWTPNAQNTLLEFIAHSRKVSWVSNENFNEQVMEILKGNITKELQKPIKGVLVWKHSVHSLSEDLLRADFPQKPKSNFFGRDKK